MMVRKATKNDVRIIAGLAVLLWDTPVGFAQCQLRHDYVEGTETTPVGYLEGIFVMEGHRRRGYAKELLNACESWAKEKGCTEFASDCELENADSFRFHMAMDFAEANRIIWISPCPSRAGRMSCSSGTGPSGRFCAGTAIRSS